MGRQINRLTLADRFKTNRYLAVRQKKSLVVKQTCRNTDGKSDSQTDRWKVRQSIRLTESQTVRWKVRQSIRQTESKTVNQIDGKSKSQTESQTVKQTDGKSDSQT